MGHTSSKTRNTPQQVIQQPLTNVSRTLPRVAGDGTTLLDQNNDLLIGLWNVLEDPEFCDWNLLFSTKDGRSFPRLVRAICNTGPTVVVMHLVEGEKDFILCSYSKTSWSTIADRRGRGVLSTFFGDLNCFLLSKDCKVGTKTCHLPTLKTKPRGPPSTSNFMYLVDESYGSCSIGIGLGGTPNCLTWFVGEDMESCCVNETSTFESMKLMTGAWTLVCFEVFSLDSKRMLPTLKREIERKTVMHHIAQDAINNNSGTSVLTSSAAKTATAILELGGVTPS